MAGEFELTPRKGPYVGRTLSDVHLIRHELEMQTLKNKQLSQTVRQIIDVAKLPKEEFTWYKMLGGRIMTRTRKNRRGGALDPPIDNDPAHDAAPVRRAQRLENARRRLEDERSRRLEDERRRLEDERRRQAGIFANEAQNRREAALRRASAVTPSTPEVAPSASEGGPVTSRASEPPALPAFASPLVRSDATHDGSLPPRRLDFNNVGGKRRKHRKTKKSTRRHRRR